MTRRKFNGDLAHASQQAIRHISHVTKGDDDGQVVFTFLHDALPSPLVIRLIALSTDDYPEGSSFLAYTDDEGAPPVISEILDDLPNLTRSKSILDTMSLISKKLSTALTCNNDDDSDVEMTDVDLDDESEPETETEEDNEEYDFDNDANFGLGSVSAFQQNINVPRENPKITGRFVNDLRKAKDAGFKIALLTDVSKHHSECIFALSLPVAHLGLTEDTLEAWEIEVSNYVVLLCRYDAGYPSVEEFTKLSANHPSSMHFRFGKCSTFKPSLSSALNAFNPKFNVDGEPAESTTENGSTRRAPFISMPISNSINAFMSTELAVLLKFRLQCGVSWDRAQELLQEITKAGHLRQDTNIQAHAAGDPGDEEAQVSTTARPLLNQDYVRSNPNVAGALSQEQLSMPLIAMQFALRYFVKSTQYCLVCHRKAEPGFTALKPYVCNEPLCLFQYMSVGLGPSIEHDIISRPCVVDLLVSFCAAGFLTDRIREWPQGLAIKVPLLMANTPRPAQGLPARAGIADNQKAMPPLEPPVIQPIIVRTSISSGQFKLDFSQDQMLYPGDTIALVKPSRVVGNTGKPDLHHCRVTKVETIKNERDNIVGRLVEFHCIVSTWRHWNIAGGTQNPSGNASETAGGDDSADEEEGEAELYLYEHDLDDLHAIYRREALMTLVQTVPPIKALQDYLLSHKGSSLTKCDKISKSALALLRWIVASNRSFIVQIDQHEVFDVGRTREHEKVLGMTGDWMQFRFAQGSPEKENRFKKELEKEAGQPRPTIFAWHGSPIGNWHSIIRSGLDFKETLHGRAYGNGVYFSPDFSVSAGYSGLLSESGPWVGSELKLTAALSLCEIINRPAKFTSTTPYYVVDQVDWIQCRYLMVQRKQTSTSHNALAATASDLRATGMVDYIFQDPKWTVTGPGNKPLGIPVTALPKWHQKASLPGSSISQPIVLDEGVDSDFDDELDDYDLILNIANNEDGDSQEDDGNTVILGSDPEKLSFTPGTLDLASLPQLPPPTWATDNGRKVLGKELSKLQRLQAKTPRHELGWYIDFESINNMFQWVVELHSFELSLPLAQDMQHNNVSSIVLEIRFGRQYPLSPPFVRVIRPRFLPFAQRGGGHVTAGGALCMELLTNSGWSPVSSMESVLLQVRMAMCSLEPFPARLIGTSGGGSGDYGVHEAINAYKRAAAAHGWQVPPDVDATAKGT